MTALQRQDNINEMKEWLLRLERHVEANKFVRHQDLNKEIENTFRDILNFVFGWKLSNANALFGQDQDSFDLSDDGIESIAVQVTVTKKAKKIHETLAKFIGKHDSTYSRLCFIYPFIQVPKTEADFSKKLNGYDFCAKRDRLTLGSILEKAQDMTVERQDEFLELLRSELRPLGKSLQFGVDQTVEALIAVIKYMSDNAPTEEINVDELKPDQQKKLNRFREHSNYLLNQYRMHQQLHATIDDARDAIGYDTVRVAKVQAWLKSNSLDILEQHNNNAQAAFKGLVDLLIEKAHVQGSDAEETAVRFLIADEFIRCNVFPNLS